MCVYTYGYMYAKQLKTKVTTNLKERKEGHMRVIWRRKREE